MVCVVTLAQQFKSKVHTFYVKTLFAYQINIELTIDVKVSI